MTPGVEWAAPNGSDHQATDAVRGPIDWKYAWGPELADTGFDASALSEFRARLVAELAVTIRDLPITLDKVLPRPDGTRG